MKIIFLDIDGVLNSLDGLMEIYTKIGSSRYCDDFPKEKHVKLLNKITNETDAKIVVSSTWRRLHHHLSLVYILFLCGVEGDVIDVTPWLGKNRGFEIQKWLDDTDENIESFVILDDDADMEHLMDYLVQTSPECGLIEKDADKAISVLMDKEKQCQS